MADVAFIAFSDIQIEDWKRYSPNHRRFFLNRNILSTVLKLCLKYKCPALFCGDLFDNNRALENYVLNYVFKWFNEFKKAGVKIYAISGNHDQSDSNYQDQQSPSYIQMMSSIYPNFINLDFRTAREGEFLISGIPYITSNVGFKKALDEVRERDKSSNKHILLIHTDLWGAKDSNGKVVDSVSNIPPQIEEFFRGFGLVLCGHIHKAQVLRRRIVMVGATHQQRISDMGTDMRIWKIDNQLRYKPIYLKTPQFRYDDGKPDDYNFIIPKPETPPVDADPVIAGFKTTNPIKLAKSFAKANNIKSKPKVKLLIKYLKHALD